MELGGSRNAARGSGAARCAGGRCNCKSPSLLQDTVQWRVPKKLNSFYVNSEQKSPYAPGSGLCVSSPLRTLESEWTIAEPKSTHTSWPMRHGEMRSMPWKQP
eukprot:672222-Prymnesium_polylepis.2